jgi:hypothetical protein
MKRSLMGKALNGASTGGLTLGSKLGKGLGAKVPSLGRKEETPECLLGLVSPWGKWWGGITQDDGGPRCQSQVRIKPWILKAKGCGKPWKKPTGGQPQEAKSWEASVWRKLGGWMPGKQSQRDQAMMDESAFWEKPQSSASLWGVKMCGKEPCLGKPVTDIPGSQRGVRKIGVQGPGIASPLGEAVGWGLAERCSWQTKTDGSMKCSLVLKCKEHLTSFYAAAQQKAISMSTYSSTKG